MTKEAIRAEMRQRRKVLPPAARDAASVAVCGRLMGMRPIESTVAVYLASLEEMDLTPFIGFALSKGIRLAAPRWNGTDYELAELNGCWPDGLVAGPHAILEPPPEARRMAAGEIGVWVVPGLAFTQNGERLGYGGGWYDRLMADAKPGALKIGVGYRFQLVDALPVEPHDVLLDEIITD